MSNKRPANQFFIICVGPHPTDKCRYVVVQNVEPNPKIMAWCKTRNEALERAKQLYSEWKRSQVPAEFWK